MKIIFAGTPEFAVPVLEALHESQHQIVAVYTQPDRPAGRGRQLTPSPVKAFALANQLDVYQPLHFNDQAQLQQLHDLQADVMVVVGYGILLPVTVLNTPVYGCINIHPSLLPKWRGPTPIQYALLHGDSVVGVSIMQLTKRMDAGPIYVQEQYTLQGDETSGQLYEQLFCWGSELLMGVLDSILLDQMQPLAQNETEATYTYKIKKADAKIDWQHSAEVIARQVRAYNPWPVAFTEYQGALLRIWQARAIQAVVDHKPGTFVVDDEGLCRVATTDGWLQLLSVQLAGKRIVAGIDFARQVVDKL